MINDKSLFSENKLLSFLLFLLIIFLLNHLFILLSGAYWQRMNHMVPIQ